MDPYAVDLEACRSRQQRLLAATEPLSVDLIVITRRESVHWLTGAYVRAPFAAIATLTSGGQVTLVLPERQESELTAADEMLGYEAKWYSTTRDEQLAPCTDVLQSRMKVAPKRVACEFEVFSPQLLLGWNAELAAIDAIMFDLRRKKDADELRMLARANEANRAMYERARQIVRPGINELDLYSELQSVAVQTLGEPLTYFGQDFRSGARGGSPRDRQIEAGELMILDLGVGFRGYHSDNARTIAVGGKPSERQLQAWTAVRSVFGFIEAEVRAGARCKQLFDTVRSQLAAYKPWTFNHHLGHGVGLAPQEGPHLNPRWDDVLAEGDYIAVEPGLYHEELRMGIRLEQNYLVTADGVELLTNWPLHL